MKPIAEIRAMSEEERRVKTAEACGWKLEWQQTFSAPDPDHELLHMVRPDGSIEIAGYFKRGDYLQLRRGMANYVPDYLHDLNACHEAEQTALKTVVLQARYLRYLKDISFDDKWTLADGWAAFATAEQRNAAFLATVL